MIKNVYEHKLRIKINEEYVLIPQITSLDVETSGTIQSWKPFELLGWDDHLKTGNSRKYVVVAIRDYGNIASDTIAKCKDKDGENVVFEFEYEFPDGEVIEFTGLVHTTKDGGGATEDNNTLEFEVYQKGKATQKTAASPVYTE